MKVVILAGGLGTRIAEESHLKPKPLIEIGDKPVLWHIMKTYAQQGFDEFIICCGYKGYLIKEYFADYYLHNADVTFDFRHGNEMEIHAEAAERWRVTLIDTGLHTMTGGRVRRIEPYVQGQPFMLTYGDGLADIDYHKLLAFHRAHGKTATVTAVRPTQRFGVLDLAPDGGVTGFREKSKDDGDTVNAGFMVLQPEIFSYLQDDGTVLEKEPLERLAAEGGLKAYFHQGFWQCMDTQRDKQQLEALWAENPPWRNW